MAIKRYDIYGPSHGDPRTEFEDPNGEWIRASDYDDKMTKISILTESLDPRIAPATINAILRLVSI